MSGTADAVVGEVETPLRILVVEDEQSYREALSAALSKDGYQVQLASDGSEGLRMFVDDPPDLVLLDVLLPGVPGAEVCRRMRAIAPVPVIIVSALDSEVDIVPGSISGLRTTSRSPINCASSPHGYRRCGDGSRHR